MKVKELAEELNVTRQTIYNHINDLKPDINKYIYKKGRTMYLQEPGINMIKDSLGLNQLKAMDNKLSTSESIEIITNTLLKYNIDMVVTMKEQLEETLAKQSIDTYNQISKSIEDESETLRKQNKELKEQLDEFNKKLDTLIDVIEKEKGKSFLDKLFNK